MSAMRIEGIIIYETGGACSVVYDVCEIVAGADKAPPSLARTMLALRGRQAGRIHTKGASFGKLSEGVRRHRRIRRT